VAFDLSLNKKSLLIMPLSAQNTNLLKCFTSKYFHQISVNIYVQSNEIADSVPNIISFQSNIDL